MKEEGREKDTQKAGGGEKGEEERAREHELILCTFGDKLILTMGFCLLGSQQ